MEGALHAAEMQAVRLLRDAEALLSGDAQDPEDAARDVAARVEALRAELHRLVDAVPRADFVPANHVLHARFADEPSGDSMRA